MVIKTLIIIAFLMILISLGSALFYLVKPKSEQHSQKTLKALTVRISLSILLFMFIFIAIANNWYQPTGMITKIHSNTPLIIN